MAFVCIPSNIVKAKEEGRSLFKGKLKKLAHVAQEHGIPISEEVIEAWSIFDYSHLRFFGYDQICEAIKDIAKIDPELASYAHLLIVIFLLTQ